jgi:hypothetical protein
MFEEKTESTEVFLPKSLEPGAYDFFVEVNFENYKALSRRTLYAEKDESDNLVFEVESPETAAGQFNWTIIGFLLIVIALLLLVIFAIERKYLKNTWTKYYFQVKIGLREFWKRWKEKRVKKKIFNPKLADPSVFTAEDNELSGLIPPDYLKEPFKDPVVRWKVSTPTASGIAPKVSPVALAAQPEPRPRSRVKKELRFKEESKTEKIDLPEKIDLFKTFRDEPKEPPAGFDDWKKKKKRAIDYLLRNPPLP